MRLSQALRITPYAPSFSRTDPHKSDIPIIAFVGAGGKTTAIFELAREILAFPSIFPKVVVTATSHMGAWQFSSADHHFIPISEADITVIPNGLTIFTGPVDGDRSSAIDQGVLNQLHAKCAEEGIPLLIEADGSRGRPLKAPGLHEPPIPNFVNQVIVVVGLPVIGKQLTEKNVFRPDLFEKMISEDSHYADDRSLDSRLINTKHIIDFLSAPDGGLKNIPQVAKRTLLLNQAETSELLAHAGNIAKRLVGIYHSIIVGSLQQKDFQVFEQSAGIILAAGGALRFGKPKQFLEWKGKSFLRHVAETAVGAGLSPVIIVTSPNSHEEEAILKDLPVIITRNEAWRDGQSTSIRKGLDVLPPHTGSALFLLVDQPQIKPELIRALLEKHGRDLPAILAPLVADEKRANPVLFDRITFPDLSLLTGDIGGRGIFAKHKVAYLPWTDENILLDVDTPEDYDRLLQLPS